MENNDIMFGDKSLDDWANLYSTQEQGQHLTNDQAVDMGLLEPETETQENTQSENKLYQMADKVGVEHPDENKEYKKLSVGETFGDIGKTLGAEALKIVAPKEDTRLANRLGWSEADLYQHQSETRIGEASKYLYRYGMGTLSFIFGGGKIGAAIKGVGAAKNSAAVAKIGTGIQKLFGADKVIKTGANASKLAKAGAFIGNGALAGSFAGGLSDFTFYRNEEGHLADAFGVTDNPMITYLQSDDNDSDAEAKFKNVVEGFIVGIPFGIGVDGIKAAGNYFKSVKKVATAQTAEEAAAALPEAMTAESNLKNILETSELADTVRNIKATADSQGLDAEQVIIDTINPKNYDDAKDMLKILDEGNDIYVKQDGTFAIKVETWEDAAKVSPDEYKSQLRAIDEDMMNDGALNYGDTALSHQDAAVRDTWTNRGWMGENESLVETTAKGELKPNSKLANKITKNYTDKWEIDNNIKVEFVDGLTINGQAVEGNTSATKYQGKTAKSKQNAIDKKKLQITKLEDKITMAEGGNAEVSDPLDNLKEELRIAQNELKELEKSNAKKDRISNITIQIDKNARNPYATLRSELEHARDLAKGEVPDQNTRHFSRYEGMNEGEVAPDYVYKKSQRKLGQTVEETQPRQEVEPEERVEVPVRTKEEVIETPTEPQQLKLNFTSVEDTVSKITQGELEPKNMGDIDTIISKTAEIDPSISGKDFEALAKDSDKLSTEIADLLDLSEAFDIKTLWQEDGDTLRKISRKQLTTTKILSQLRDKMAALGKDAPIETKRRYVDTINSLMAYVSDIGSAKGTLLNEQKFLNKALETFGSQRLSKLNKEGIYQFVDLLKESIDEINLQFTRGSAIEKKQALYAKLAELDPTLLAVIGEDLEFAAKFDKIVDDIVKNPQMDMQKAYQGLENIFTEREYVNFIDKAELAPTKKGWFTTLKNWSNEQGGLASYYVHNLLSGVGSLFKNIASGGINTVYFPARKILAGLTDMNLSTEQKGQLYREGINTYKNLITTWNESWQLCCQAFLKGDGKLSSIGNDTLNMDETFRGFHEIGVDGGNSFWETVQNIHSIMTRAMGASDELMSQLNYRSIARAKAMETADKLAMIAGKANDEAWIDETTNTIFKKYFTADGKPLDATVYNEAKTILYQNPLDGKLTDPQTGGEIDMRTGKFLEKGEKATQTAAMRLGASFQKAANENLLVKFFFPFVKTGTNILQMNLDHNIWYNLASPTQRQILKSNTVEGALLRSQCTFGAFSFTLGTMLALNGMVTGSMPSDAKERKALLATGWRPYSVKVGNKYVSYQGYEPIHTMLGFSADFANLMMSVKNKNDEDRALKFAMQAGSVFVNNFLDKAAFRTGLRSLSALFELDERHIADWQQAIAQPLSGLLPNSTMVKNISSVGERAATSPKSVYERVFNMYFNRGLGEYRRDAFGDKQNIFNAIITSSSSQGTEPEYTELSRLAELGYKPTEVGETISGYSLNYNDFIDPETGRSAYDIMQEELSKTDLKEKVRELVTSDYYQSLDDGINNTETKAQGYKWSASDDTKVNMLNDLFIEYNDLVKEKVENEYPNLVNKNGQTIQEAAEQAEIIKMNKQLNNQLNDSAEKIKSIF